MESIRQFPVCIENEDIREVFTRQRGAVQIGYYVLTDGRQVKISDTIRNPDEHKFIFPDDTLERAINSNQPELIVPLHE